jgi:hypothetical protein
MFVRQPAIQEDRRRIILIQALAHFFSLLSLTPIPGQPNHRNSVDLVSPDNAVTSPPLEIDD